MSAVARTRLIDDLLAEALRAIAGPDTARQRNLGMQTWAETVREPRIRALARKGVDDRLEAFGEVAPEAVVRALVAIYQGLLLQASWDDDLDVEAFVTAVGDLLRRRL